METWDAIRSRRNVRSFTSDPIPDRDLDQILEAGRRAPSSQNWQPWDFVVVTERAQLTRLAEVWKFGAHIARAAGAIALIGPVVDEETPRQWLYFDHGQAAMLMQVVAADLGIGSSHSAVGDHDLARVVLGHPDDRICTAILSLGYPLDRPLRPLQRFNRRPFEGVVHHGRW